MKNKILYNFIIFSVSISVYLTANRNPEEPELRKRAMNVIENFIRTIKFEIREYPPDKNKAQQKANQILNSIIEVRTKKVKTEEEKRAHLQLLKGIASKIGLFYLDILQIYKKEPKQIMDDEKNMRNLFVSNINQLNKEQLKSMNAAFSAIAFGMYNEFLNKLEQFEVQKIEDIFYDSIKPIPILQYIINNIILGEYKKMYLKTETFAQTEGISFKLFDQENLLNVFIGLVNLQII